MRRYAVCASGTAHRNSCGRYMETRGVIKSRGSATCVCVRVSIPWRYIYLPWRCLLWGYCCSAETIFSPSQIQYPNAPGWNVGAMLGCACGWSKRIALLACGGLPGSER
uniref:Uncharacterized protein n=1 Tax=Anopheles minimus TaxID=112268 RepID=A0A182WQ18_9DIPT